jgi:hypothetical protein
VVSQSGRVGQMRGALRGEQGSAALHGQLSHSAWVLLRR